MWGSELDLTGLGYGPVKLKPCASTKHHAMKAYWGSGCISPRRLDLGTKWRWVVSFTQWSFSLQGKSPCYPLDRGFGRPQSRSGRDGEEKNSQPLLGLEHLTIQPIAQCCITEISRLPCGPVADSFLKTVMNFLILQETEIISVGFWRWCVGIVRIVLLDFIHRLVSQKIGVYVVCAPR
jgi:hypothetical protein